MEESITTTNANILVVALGLNRLHYNANGICYIRGMHLRFKFIIVPLVIFSLAGCKEENSDTNFYGNVKLISSGVPAAGVKMVFTGIKIGRGLWPSIEEVSRHTVTVDSKGNFNITIPETANVEEFRMSAEDASGNTTLGFDCDTDCTSLRPGTTRELLLHVDF